MFNNLFKVGGAKLGGFSQITNKPRSVVVIVIWLQPLPPLHGAAMWLRYLATQFNQYIIKGFFFKLWVQTVI